MVQITAQTTEFCRTQAARFDRERFLIALSVPKALRGEVLTLLAFNIELAQCALAVSDPMLGIIRLAWWREVLDEIYGNAQVRNHPVAVELERTVRAHNLPRELLEPMIEARSLDLEAVPYGTLDGMQDYCRQTSGLLAQACMRACGESDTQHAKTLGTVWGVLGQLRNVGFQAGRQRCVLPEALLNAHGLETDVSHWPHHPQALQATAREIAAALRPQLEPYDLPPMLRAYRTACLHYLNIVEKHDPLQLLPTTGRARLALKLLFA